MSAPVKQWVQSLRLREYEVPSDRSKGGNRRLGATHFRVLLHIADRARHNGLAWPGMADIAKAAEIGANPERPDLRRARRLVRDLEDAGLIKSELFRGRVKGKEYASNEYWVRVPWIDEPERVSGLPKLGNDEIPLGARVKELKGGRVEIDVDHYIRQARVRPLNRAPEPYLDPIRTAISGAGDTVEGGKSGAGDTLNRAPVSPVNRAPAPAKPGNSGEPGSEAAKSSNLSTRTERETNRNEDGHLDVQLTLTGLSALSIPGSSDVQRVVVAQSPADALEEGRRIWGVARQQLFRTGQDRVLEQRLRNTGTAGYDAPHGVLTLDGDLSAEDLEPGSLVMSAVAAAAGRYLQVQLVRGLPQRPLRGEQTSSVESEEAEPATPNPAQPDDDADRRARFEQRLSPDDRALLQELERQRLAYVEAGEVADTASAAPISPYANAIDEASSESGRTTSAEVTADDRSGGPRKRRKRELVA